MTMTSGHMQSVWVRRDGNSSLIMESLSKVSFVPVIVWRPSLSPTNLYRQPRSSNTQGQISLSRWTKGNGSGWWPRKEEETSSCLSKGDSMERWASIMKVKMVCSFTLQPSTIRGCMHTIRSLRQKLRPRPTYRTISNG